MDSGVEQIRINRAFVNFFELCVEFSNGIYGDVEYSGHPILDPKLNRSMGRLLCFINHGNRLEWKALPELATESDAQWNRASGWADAFSISAEELYAQSKHFAPNLGKKSYFRLSHQGLTDAAGKFTGRDYGVGLYPFRSDEEKPYILVISTGAGTEDQAVLSHQELLNHPRWKEFFAIAGCSWAVELFENYKGPADELPMLVVQTIRQSYLDKKRIPLR